VGWGREEFSPADKGGEVGGEGLTVSEIRARIYELLGPDRNIETYDVKIKRSIHH